MSNSNYYLVSVIVYVISIIEHDDPSISKLVKDEFFSVIDSFLCQQLQGNERSQDLLSAPNFTNIIYYALGFIDVLFKKPSLDYYEM